MSRTEAKRQYITTLIETMHQYATTTPEARELVAELEFVWDQIKSNPASPSDSQDQAHHLPNLQQSPLFAKSLQASKTNLGGLRDLRPFSDEEDGIEDAGELTDNDEVAFGQRSAGEPAAGYSTQDLDIRNWKWKKRVEQALVKMTVELAALREQIESSASTRRTPRSGIGNWLAWVAWTSTKHLLVDATLLCVVLVWARSRRDPSVDKGLQSVLSWIREQGRGFQLPRIRSGAKS